MVVNKYIQELINLPSSILLFIPGVLYIDYVRMLNQTKLILASALNDDTVLPKHSRALEQAWRELAEAVLRSIA